MSRHRTLELLARASLTHEDCPEPHTLAAYALNLLSGNEQLEVAQHVRECPLCLEEVALVRPSQRRPRPLIARLLLSSASGFRGETGSDVRQYQAADITLELTIVRQRGDEWRLTGQVLRANLPMPALPVSLRRGRGRVQQQQSDHDGFFTFTALPAGRYTLSVTDGATLVQVRDLEFAPVDG